MCSFEGARQTWATPYLCKGVARSLPGPRAAWGAPSPACSRVPGPPSLAARRRDSLEEVRQQIESAGGKAVAVAMDVTNAQSVTEAIREAAARLGKLDILVNNAGVTRTKPFLEIDEADWDQQVDTNLKGAFLAAQAAARTMRDQGGGGAIVNIASILGLRVAGQVAAYLTSKAGIVHLTKGMALELARHRIRVNALCPGYIETDLNREFFASDTGRALIKRIPQRRLGQAHGSKGRCCSCARKPAHT